MGGSEKTRIWIYIIAMVEYLQQINPLFTILAFIIAIVGIILAIVFYLKGKKARKPMYFIQSNNLVAGFSKRLGKLQLLYGDTSIENLTVSKIAFWNDGETIEWGSIVEEDPLRVESLGNCDILDANVIKEINPINKFGVDLINRKEARILFTFLDKGQGGAIQVIHTGKGSSDIEVGGFIKGAGKPRPSYRTNLLAKIGSKIFSTPKQKQQKESPIKQRRAFGLFSLLSAIFIIISLVGERNPVFIVVGIIIILVLFYFCYQMFRRRVPKELEIVEEEEEEIF